jgi:RTX calcium-binding nonapeptide repeat (4 copies)
MALIIGTTGDDAQIIDLVNQPDTIYGDQQGTLTGEGGDDRIFGRDSNDTLIGDADGIAAGGTGGNDLIVGGEGDDRIFGDAFELFGVGGNDVLRSALPGESLSDVIYGDAERLRAGAVGGDDHVEGMFVVGDGATLEDARGGNDKLHTEGTTAAVTPNLHGDASGAISGAGVGGDDVLRAAPAATGCSATPAASRARARAGTTASKAKPATISSSVTPPRWSGRPWEATTPFAAAAATTRSTATP